MCTSSTSSSCSARCRASISVRPGSTPQPSTTRLRALLNRACALAHSASGTRARSITGAPRCAAASITPRATAQGSAEITASARTSSRSIALASRTSATSMRNRSARGSPAMRAIQASRLDCETSATVTLLVAGSRSASAAAAGPVSPPPKTRMCIVVTRLHLNRLARQRTGVDVRHYTSMAMTPENNQQQTDSRTAPEHVSAHDESATSDGMLERGLGGAAATAIIIGGMIGSGIFRAPSIVADHAGSPGMSLIVWGVCGLVALCGGLCVAELGAMMPKTGGLYVYLREAFRSRFIAFSYGWAAFWLIWPVSMAAVAAVFATYLAVIVEADRKSVV